MNGVRGLGDGSDERWSRMTGNRGGGRRRGGFCVDPRNDVSEEGLEGWHAGYDDCEVDLDQALCRVSFRFRGWNRREDGLPHDCVPPLDVCNIKVVETNDERVETVHAQCSNSI